MRRFVKQLFLGAGLATTTAFSASTAMASDDFLADYSTSKWQGGSIDNDDDGLSDFCIMLPKRPDRQVLLILDTQDGVMLGLINPSWQMEDIGGLIDVDIVIPGHWNSEFSAKITDTDTLAVTIGPLFEMIDAIKAGNELFAYHYIGDFEVTLSGTHDAMNTVQRCFREQIEPHLVPDTPTVKSTAPPATYQDGKDAFDAAEYQSALAIWQQVAKEGNANAMNGIGLILRSGRGVPNDYQTARVWFQRAADLGLAEAQYNLARLHDKGRGTDVDYDQAVIWYRKAAAQGYDRAQLLMGIKSLKGQGVEKNLEAARHWYLLAAQNGNRAAQFNLATLLRKGRGGAPDPEQALYWYRRSAEQGHSFALLRLGDALSKGLWGQPDPVEGYKWYLLASEHGKEEANDRLAELQGRVSQADQQQASRLASQWVAMPEPRTTSLVAQPVALPTQPIPQPTNEPMQIVTKPLPDDLFGEPETKLTHSAPVPVAAAQGDMRIEGCFDRSQAAATCQTACTAPTFAEKMAASQFARKKGAQAPVQYCLNGCQQAEDEFNQALNTVAVFKESKFFCPKLYEETMRLAKENNIPREHGDKSARKSHATGSDTCNKATRLVATPEQLAALSRTPYSPALRALVDQMPLVLEGCYDTQSSAAMDYCRAECTKDAKFPNKGLTSEEAAKLCFSGCDQATELFKDQTIWLQARNEDGKSGTFCSGIRFTDIAREEARINALVDGHPKHAVGEIIGGISNYWRGALIAGGY